MQLLVSKKEHNIFWVHVGLEARLRKPKQAASTKYKDDRVEMCCRC
jgi:hypothetical protein